MTTTCPITDRLALAFETFVAKRDVNSAAYLVREWQWAQSIGSNHTENGRIALDRPAHKLRLYQIALFMLGMPSHFVTED